MWHEWQDKLEFAEGEQQQAEQRASRLEGEKK